MPTSLALLQGVAEYALNVARTQGSRAYSLLSGLGETEMATLLAAACVVIFLAAAWSLFVRKY